MAKPKEISATTEWKEFLTIIKKCKKLSSSMIVVPGGHYYLNKEDPGMESYVVIKSGSLMKYFEWAVVDIPTVIEEVKNRDIKVTGTLVTDDMDKVSIFKNDEHQFDINKLPSMAGVDPFSYANTEYKMNLAFKNYRKLPGFIYTLEDSTGWDMLSESDIATLNDRSVVEYEGDGFTLTLAKSLFPLMGEDTSIYIKKLLDDTENGKVYVGFREEYDKFTVYSIVAVLSIELA